jgi:hypothetical protein
MEVTHWIGIDELPTTAIASSGAVAASVTVISCPTDAFANIFSKSRNGLVVLEGENISPARRFQMPAPLNRH